MTHRTYGDRLWAMLTCVPTMLLLAGCGEIPGLDAVAGFFSSAKEVTATDAAASERISTGDEPIKFAIGDQYTFDSPVERWVIMAIKNDRVYWRNDLGERKVTGFNPLLPPQEWQGRTKGSGRRLIRDREGALFPMRVGATLKFRSTVTSDRPPFGWERNWTCLVASRESLETLGGRFDTYVVNCGYDGADGAIPES